MSEQTGTRVNRISVSMMEDGEGARISLYKTNTRLVEIFNGDIGVPQFSLSKLPNKQVYAQYCREVMMNLLKNGGVEGFYYDDENHSPNKGLPSKFTRSSFVQHACDMIFEIMSPIQTSMSLVIKMFDILDTDDLSARVVVEETYPDGHIKYAKVPIRVEVESADGRKEIVIIDAEIKSGQLCKPKYFSHGGHPIHISATNVVNLFPLKPTTIKLSGNMVTIKVGHDKTEGDDEG